MTITGDLNDVLWLAQVHYNRGQYVSDQKLMWNLIDSSAIKMEKYQEVLDILDDEIPFLDRDYNSVDKSIEGGIEWDFVHSLKFDEQLENEDAILSK
ncbi:hypothetical protein C2G38_2255756 [Gigaspora rosea]|uniref:Uncharacterized protein n=1 Tax=Gigaspora rosea TaxID=44941 RepID=A0A397TVL7_9GLOM|nr:hypothetical protein C2G38_2255756 [Gigaspora rosea]